METLLRGSTLPIDMQDAVLARVAMQKCLVWQDGQFTRNAVHGLREPVVLQSEQFTLHNVSLESMGTATGHIYCRNARGAMEQAEAQVGEIVKQAWGDNKPCMAMGIFDICGLTRDVTPKMRNFFRREFDVYDDGAVISLGQTFTKYHVEDLALANIQTLQRVHRSRDAAFKIWFIETSPARGLMLKRANEHTMSPRLARDAEFIVIQREGDTIYLPPLCYHAVVTAYGNRVPLRDQYAVLSGTFFADLREGSVWRERLPLWLESHHTGRRHGSIEVRYAQYLPSKGQRSERRPSKKRVRKDKATAALLQRWGM